MVQVWGKWTIHTWLKLETIHASNQILISDGILDVNLVKAEVVQTISNLYVRYKQHKKQ